MIHRNYRAAITVRALPTAGDVARPRLLHHGAVMPLFLRRPASLAQQAGSCFGRWLQCTRFWRWLSSPICY